MISINEAVHNNIERIRMPKWANRQDYLQLDIIDGYLGPWLHLYSPMNEEINGQNPIDILSIEFNLDAVEYEIWQAPSALSAIAKPAPEQQEQDGE